MHFYHCPNGTQVAYRDKGQGEVIVLLHGLASSNDDWDIQISALSQHFRVIAPDLRGHGQSSKADSSFQIAHMVEDCMSLLSHLNIERYHLVGFSLGGMVAFEWATLSPQQLRTLSIINSAPGIPQQTWRLRWELLKRKMVIRCMGMERLGKVIGERLFPADNQSDLRQRFSQQMQKMDKKSYERTLDAIGKFNVYHKLGDLTMPVLIVSADNDYTSVSSKEAYVKLLADARLVVIANSRHATPVDQPEKTNETLLTFLQHST